MAKKSKTQRAKASANRAAKKERAQQQEAVEVVEEEPKKRFGFSKKDSSEKSASKTTPAPQQQKKSAKKKRKINIRFLNDVAAEMRRVTWPSKQEVAQWSGVVVVALLFFGIYVVILDDWIVTPILLAISGLGA